MSGGSLDYAYQRIDDMIAAIETQSQKPLHMAFVKHLAKIKTALHDLEWVFSGDCSEPSEEAAIKAVLPKQKHVYRYKFFEYDCEGNSFSLDLLHVNKFTEKQFKILCEEVVLLTLKQMSDNDYNCLGLDAQLIEKAFKDKGFKPARVDGYYGWNTYMPKSKVNKNILNWELREIVKNSKSYQYLPDSE